MRRLKRKVCVNSAYNEKEGHITKEIRQIKIEKNKKRKTEKYMKKDNRKNLKRLAEIMR